MRRELKFTHLREAMAESEALLASGYERAGNWTLAQICHHLRLTIDSNMNGYPSWMTIVGYPLRPLVRWLVLPQILAGKSRSGVPTAGMFVPPDDLADEAEVAALLECVERFLKSNAPLHPHPGFGLMTREGFNHFHAAHAAHHLSFLRPTSVTKR